MVKGFTLILSFLIAVGVSAQSASPALALDYVRTHTSAVGITSADAEQLIVSDHVRNNLAGAEHVYLQQTVGGIPVQGAYASITIKDQEVLYQANTLISDASSKVVGLKAPQLTAQKALEFAAKHIGVKAPTATLRKSADGHSVFEGGNISAREIEVKPVYHLGKDGKLHISYGTMIDALDSKDLHHITVNATSGEVTDYFNGTITCNFGDRPHKHVGHDCKSHSASDAAPLVVKGSAVDGAQYLAYPFPMESPFDGDRQLLVEPADLDYSPFGWHDRDGVEGADATTTRGNNVLAFNSTTNLSPDGGAELDFSFDLDFQDEPANQLEPAIANLFYANNYMHDFSARVGFDEAAGNFQEVNYSGNGEGGDFVRAEAQDPTGTNNATFGTLPEGSVSEMSMFLWDAGTGGFLTINEPTQIAGLLSNTGQSFNLQGGTDWGNNLVATGDAITGNVAIANDRRNTQCCLEIETDLTGKVALIDRGGCDFSLKAANAQDAGAIGVMIVNVPGADGAGSTGDNVIGMNGGDRATEVNIPALFLALPDGDRMRQVLNNGLDVTVTFESIENTGPSQIDASLDNGVIAHEFGHGISTRLTAGPRQVGCLRGVDDDGDGRADRGEQMGEGWSDFFTLVTTAKEGDQGSDPRAIGNYADDQGPTGSGIRNFPYSTDMSIYPSTFAATQSVGYGGTTGYAPHPVGEVWCAMLWDMYWALSDRDGYDPTLRDETSGSYKAVRLVMDGMKLQPCNPGFQQGRDAILAADEMLYGGENQRLIWEVFARRGMGFLAESGDTFDHRDGLEDFSIPPLLIEQLKINRNTAEVITVGEEHEVSIDVVNHIPEAQSGVIVTDELAEGMSYVAGTTAGASEPTVNGQVLTFELGELAYQDEVTFTYSVVPSQDLTTQSLLFDDFESDNGWEALDLEGSDFTWEEDNDFGRDDSNGWGVYEFDQIETDQALLSPEIEVVGELPVLRFWHRYETTRISHGGYVGVIPEGDDFATPLANDQFILNGYPAEVQYGLFAIPSLGGFTGTSEGEFVESYVNLSAYKDQRVRIQFRFGTQETVNSDILDPAWSVDDFEILDLQTIPSTACVFSDSSTDPANCAASVTIVEPSVRTDIEEVSPDAFGLEVFPNPADDYITITAAGDMTDEATISLRAMDGRVAHMDKMMITGQPTVKTISVGGLASGMYVLELRTADKVTNTRVIIY